MQDTCGLYFKKINNDKRKNFKCGLTCIVWVFPLLVTPYANIVPETKTKDGSFVSYSICQYAIEKI